MESIPVTPIMYSIIDKYLNDTYIYKDGYKISTRSCLRDNKVIPYKVYKDDVLLYTVLSANEIIPEGMSFTSINDNNIILNSIDLTEFNKIRGLIRRVIDNEYPNGLKDVYYTPREDDRVRLFKEYDLIMDNSDFIGAIRSDIPLVFLRVSMYPDTIKKAVKKSEHKVINIVRHPKVEFLVNITHGEQEHEPWPRVENVSYRYIEDIVYAVLFKLSDNVNTIRYEDIFSGNDFNIGDETYSIPASDVNSYVSLYDMSSLTDGNNQSLKNSLRYVDVISKFGNIFSDTYEESLNNINHRKAQNLPHIMDVLEDIKGDVIHPPLVFMGAKNFTLYKKLSVPLWNKYRKNKSIFTDLKSRDITFNTLFRYPIIDNIKVAIPMIR